MTQHFSFRYLSRILIFCLVITCGIPLSQVCAVARTTDKKTIRLNLSQMIKRAVAESPETGAAQSDLIAAESSLDAISAAFYPRIESTAIVGPVQDAKDPIIVNNRIYDPSPGLSLSNINVFGQLDFTVIQPLYTFGKLTNQKNAARMGVDAQRQEIVKTADDIALRVTQLYYALILAQTGLNATLDAQNFFNDARHRVEALLKVKSPNASQSDLYRIDAFRAGVDRSQIEARKGMAVAAYALRAMLKIPPGVKFEAIPEPLEVKTGSTEKLEAYVQQAYSNRPEFKQLSAALKAKQYQTEAAKSDLYPSFFAAIEGFLAGAPGREHFSNLYITDTFNRDDVGVIVGAKWDIDFGIKKARIRQARAEYHKLLDIQKRAQMDIPIQVAKAFDELIEWKKSAKIYHNAAISSRKWVVSAFADFDMGLGTAENLLRAIEKYGENQGNYIQALYNYNMAVANLKYATGTIRDNGQK